MRDGFKSANCSSKNDFMKRFSKDINKASEMLVAPRISKCFGVPWFALDAAGLAAAGMAADGLALFFVFSLLLFVCLFGMFV